MYGSWTLLRISHETEPLPLSVSLEPNCTQIILDVRMHAARSYRIDPLVTKLLFGNIHAQCTKLPSCQMATFVYWWSREGVVDHVKPAFYYLRYQTYSLHPPEAKRTIMNCYEPEVERYGA